MLSGVVGDQTGQLLDTAREEILTLLFTCPCRRSQLRERPGQIRIGQVSRYILTPSAARLIKQAGVEFEPQPVQGEIEGLPLMRAELTRYQQLSNKYLDIVIHKLVALDSWLRASVYKRDLMLREATKDARERAAQETLRSIPRVDLQRRVQAVRERRR